MKNIIEMAKKAGIEIDDNGAWITKEYWEQFLNRFVELVREDERETCAKVCDEAVQITRDAKAMLKPDETIEKIVAIGAIYKAEKLAAAIRARDKND